MITESQRKSLWESLLDADYQQRYWHAKACDFSRLERTLQILLAVFSSAAVITLLGNINSGVFLKVFAGLTAVVATIQPFLNLTRRSMDMIAIASEWHQLEIEYDALWRNIENSTFPERRFKELKSREVEIFKKIDDLPIDDLKLQKISQKQVLIGRGLPAV